MQEWRSRRDANGRLRPQVEAIVLVGARAHHDGLVQDLERALAMSVTLGNPWLNVPLQTSYVPPIHTKDVLAYATAIGLAMQ